MSNLTSGRCIFCSEPSNKKICFICLGDGKRIAKSIHEQIAPCRHEFIANAGKGGFLPIFKIIKKISRNKPVMQVKCGRCHYYCFITKNGWENHEKLRGISHA